MSKYEEVNQSDENSKKTGAISPFGVFIITFAMVFVMAISIYYPFQNEKTLSLSSFFRLWFRELIAVGLVVIILLVFAIKKQSTHFHARVLKAMHPNAALKALPSVAGTLLRYAKPFSSALDQ